MNSRTREPAANAPLSAHERGAERDEEPSRRICVGVVTGPQGVHGAVRIKSFTEVPENVAGYGLLEDETGRRQFDLRLCGVAKGVVIARLPGIEDRDQAEALRGLRLYLSRSALPQPEAEEFYHADLIGLDAVLGDGTRGRARARDLRFRSRRHARRLARDGAPPVLVPFTRAVVPVIEPAEAARA